MAVKKKAVKKKVGEWEEKWNDKGKGKVLGGVVKIEGKRIKIVLTYMREERQKNWEEIERVGVNGEGAVLIMGDFNARTGKKGGEWGEQGSLRESRDECINAEGEEMLVRSGETGMQILNGGVNGDEEEKFTYVGPTGLTVIDYLVVNEERCNIVDEMEVMHRTDFDHAALEIKLEGEVRREGRKEEK